MRGPAPARPGGDRGLSGGRLLIAAPDPSHPDVAALRWGAEQAGYRWWVVRPAGDAWGEPDPALVEAAADLPSRPPPLVLAGHDRGATPACGSYRAIADAIGVICVRLTSSLPATACRLDIGPDGDVAACTRDWLLAAARWRGERPPPVTDVRGVLLRAARGETAPGDPDPVVLLEEMAQFHPHQDAIAGCCEIAAGAPDPRLRASAMYCVGTILGGRWYGYTEQARTVAFTLQHDADAAAADPRFGRAVGDFWQSVR